MHLTLLVFVFSVKGCFTSRLLPTFTLPTNCPSRRLSHVCPNEHVKFWLYTRNMREPYQIKENDITNLAQAPFLPNIPVKVIIHGFTSNSDNEANLFIRPEYLKRNYNVISVDYSQAAPFPCYIESAANVVVVGNCTSRMLQAIMKYSNVSLEQIHVIGFSLGGQIAGYIGTYFNNANSTLRRITGLDPALLLYYFNSTLLNKDCANFVDVIHTDSGINGKVLPGGDIDFYIDQVVIQSGCVEPICSHLRSTMYFGESINSQVGFYGKPLNKVQCLIIDLVIMGEYTPPMVYKESPYYLKTRALPPYALGKHCF